MTEDLELSFLPVAKQTTLEREVMLERMQQTATYLQEQTRRTDWSSKTGRTIHFN